ncbi:MAG: ankyrin repeat domain-containing protein [Desulfobacterales bacterium]|jgi:ankyrin repeat protein
MSVLEDIRSYQMRNFSITILVIIFSASLIQTAHAASSSDDVYQAQKKLKELGYDPGAIDGIWGRKTTLAIKRFQREKGLPVTGQLDQQTRAELIDRKPPSQRSFNQAIKRDDFITVKALIAAGVDVNAKNKSGETPLHIAAVRGYQEITSVLIDKGANVNAIDGRELTPLHAAAWGGHKETVALLIANGAEVDARGDDGVTPMLVSTLSGRNDTMELLINNGANINARNRSGMTPLHAAALMGQYKAVELLVNKGADVNAKNNEGITPLQIASRKGYQSIVTLLEKHVR